MTLQESNTTPPPRAERPSLPAAYGVPAGLAGVLPWEWAEARLTAARTFWICTTRPDGRPHAVPLWGVWVEGRFYFDGGGQKARNLAANPAITVHLEGGDEVVILEGVWERGATPDAARFERIRAAYGHRYGYRPERPAGLYAVRPRTVIAWHRFPQDATRWRFPDPPPAPEAPDSVR